MKKSANEEDRSRRSTPHWCEGTVQQFLNLSEQEAALVRTKATLAVRLQRRRKGLAWSQAELAELMGSGQSRVAKMEAAHPSVSLELLVKALLSTGVTISDIGAVVSTGDPEAAARGRRAVSRRAKRRRRASKS
jgi:transcriptional regulator with XRE-family HTH domain